MNTFLKILSIFLLIFIFKNTIFAQENIFEMRLQQQFQKNLGGNENATLSISIPNHHFSNPQNITTPLVKNPDFVMEFHDMNTGTNENYDFGSDASITKFVGKNHSFHDKNYIPDDLQTIAGKYISGSGMLRGQAKKSLDEMGEQFFKKFRKKLPIFSVYRSYEDQLFIQKSSPQCIKNHLCAYAGHSEHQSGLAIDIAGLFGKNKKSPEYEWLQQNAHHYGWTQSYQKGKDIDGYQRENWHWRYLGRDLAMHLKEKNITFTEFFMKK